MPSVTVDTLDLVYSATGITGAPDFTNTAAARRYFGFTGGTKIGNDGWSLTYRGLIGLFPIGGRLKRQSKHCNSVMELSISSGK